MGFRVGEEKRVLGVKGVLEGGEEKRVLGVKEVLEGGEEKRVLERGGEARMGMA